MEQAIRDDVERLSATNVFANYVGLEVREYDTDRAILTLKAGERHLNPLGFVHGGVLYTLADCATGVAARTNGCRYVTQSGSLNFLRSGRAGDTLEARAVVRRRGRSTCYTEVDVVDQDNTLLATGSFTFFRVSDQPRS